MDVHNGTAIPVSSAQSTTTLTLTASAAVSTLSAESSIKTLASANSAMKVTDSITVLVK